MTKNKIDHAINFIKLAHLAQSRKYSNVPYIFHCFDVANRLTKWGIYNETMICSALLHDVLEDSEIHIPIDEFKKAYGDKITKIVQELTFTGTGQRQKQIWLDNFKNKLPESIVIKIADRICNIEDFIAAGEIEYANKYKNRANKLFNLIENDAGNTPTRFIKLIGQNSIDHLKMDIAHLKSILQSQPKPKPRRKRNANRRYQDGSHQSGQG